MRIETQLWRGSFAASEKSQIGMHVIGYILLVLGLIGCLYWQLRFLVVAYRQSLLWFLGCLLVPFVDLVFLLLHFKIARKPFGLCLLGLIVAGFGGWLAGVEWPA